jgi:hypothetical protein
MESITLTITEERIRSAMEESISKILKSDYGNPVKDAVEAAIKDKQGEIKKVIDQIIVDAINDPEFKRRIADSVISKMVESALKK